MSANLIYTQTSEALHKLFCAAVFNDGFTKSKSEQKELSDANSVICKINFYLSTTKHVSKSEVEKLFSNFYKAFKKTRKYDQVLQIIDAVFYIQTCMNKGDGDAIESFEYEGVDFVSDSECESSTDEEIESDCDSESACYSGSDVESDDDSDDEMEVEIVLEDKNLVQINRYINQLLKAKIFKEEIDDIVVGSDDVPVYEVLDEVRDMLDKAVRTLSKYLNGITSDISYVKNLLSSALDNLEMCVESVGKKHEEQMELLKDRVHWIFLMMEMNDDEVKDEFACYNVKGLKMSR